MHKWKTCTCNVLQWSHNQEEAIYPLWHSMQMSWTNLRQVRPHNKCLIEQEGNIRQTPPCNHNSIGKPFEVVVNLIPTNLAPCVSIYRVVDCIIHECSATNLLTNGLVWSRQSDNLENLLPHNAKFCLFFKHPNISWPLAPLSHTHTNNLATHPNVFYDFCFVLFTVQDIRAIRNKRH